jgi:hypothetical protein
VFGTEYLTLFLISGILLNITPGQDTLYPVGRGRMIGIRRIPTFEALPKGDRILGFTRCPPARAIAA